MPIITASIDTLLATGAAATAGTYFLLKRTQHKSQSPYRNALNVLVVLHTLYIVYVLTVRVPPNLFQKLGIPLNTPPDKIRSIILDSAGLEYDATLPRPLETLLTRLSSFDGRHIYVRFGQSVIQDCEYCRSFDQYALFALPKALLQYLRETAVLGLITSRDSHRSSWRPLAVVALAAAGLAEAYYILNAQITIPRDGKGVFFWADNLWCMRQLLFLVLPIAIHSLPARLPTDPFMTMLQVRTTLDITARQLASMRFLHGAISREPTLRASAMQWWDRSRAAGRLLREDENVQRTAEKWDSGFVEGLGEAKMLPKLRAATENLLARVDPNIHPGPRP